MHRHVVSAAAAAGAGLAFAFGSAASAAATQHAQAHAEAGPPPAFNPQEWRPFTVAEKEQVNHNSVRLRLSLPNADQNADLPVASCILVRAPIGSQKEDGSPAYVMRPYTPISQPHARGFFELLVKVYPSGTMSKHIGELSVGDSLECKGPISKLPYEPNMKKKIGMICGGSGVTPMYQVARRILEDPDDKTEVSLVYANVSTSDILLKKEWDELAKEHANFEVHYVVDKAPTMGALFWRGSVGRINQDIIAKHCPPPEEGNLVMVCGPPGMYKAISGEKAPDKTQGEVSGILKDMGFDSNTVFKF